MAATATKRPALFQSGAANTTSENMVEFRAGKLTLGANGMLTADARKGTVYIRKKTRGTFTFFWKDLSTGINEDKVDIKVGDARVVKLPECTTGRAIVVQFLHDVSKRHFYWMQSKDATQDDALLTKMNKLFSRSTITGSTGSSSVTSRVPNAAFPGQAGGGQMSDMETLAQILNAIGPENEDIMNILPSLSDNPQQLLEAMGMMRNSGATANDGQPAIHSQAPGARSAGNSSASAPAKLPNTRAAVAEMAKAQELAMKSFKEMFTFSNIHPLVKDFHEKLKDSYPKLNDSAKTDKDSFLASLQSAQFQAAVGTFAYALSTGHLGSLMQQFDIGKGACDAAGAGNLEEFITKLQEDQGDQKMDES